jgi:positive regulator of sigma E activity
VSRPLAGVATTRLVHSSVASWRHRRLAPCGTPSSSKSCGSRFATRAASPGSTALLPEPLEPVRAKSIVRR